MPLILDLLRHGEAYPSAAGGDSARALTRQGEAAARELGSRLAQQGWRPDRVFASPYLRAQQTVSIVIREAGCKLAVETLAELEPDRDPRQVWKALDRERATTGLILLVGHQPLLGDLIAHLTAADSSVAAGELVRVACPTGFGERNSRILSRMR